MKTFLIILASLLWGVTINAQLVYEETFENSRYYNLSAPSSPLPTKKVRDIDNCNPQGGNTGDTAHGTIYDWTLFRDSLTPFRGSKYSVFEIRKDQPRVGTSQKVRSEVQIINPADPYWPGRNIWYSYATYYPTIGSEYDVTREVITQWYQDGTNETTIRRQSDKCYIEVTPPAGSTTLLKYDLWATSLNTDNPTSVTAMVAYPKDQWHEFVFHIIWSTGSDGIIEIWRNGLKIQVINGRNMHIDPPDYPKEKIGLYKASFLDGSSLRYSRRIYFDNVRVGDSTSTLATMVSTTPSNIAPAANAGVDKAITLPTATTSFTGAGTDADGAVSTYAWTQISGPNTATITMPATASTTVTGLVAGSYTFRLTVTDNNGATGSDLVLVTVTPASPPPANNPPTAGAGTDQSLQLPINTTSLSGTAADSDGTFTLLWVKTSGPNIYTITNETTLTPSISNLDAGVYVFTIYVTDDDGAVTTDSMTVTVLAVPVSGGNGVRRGKKVINKRNGVIY